MFKPYLIAAIVAAGIAAAPAAFASGYGPAPHYNPFAGAPASQRGQSAQTLHAEAAQWMIDQADVAKTSYGAEGHAGAESGARLAPVDTASLYAHH
ncbi:hypothetical protein QHI69_28200 [Burkholderia gladioli pv. gladioli]|uniref:hypothetical protein n=1 Tax=Burkholderia gladioli TaxID=28095 RepID=UPI0024BBF467|nr:hypothetical protein [Burkholderia gladioli]MDJ1165788.1 hypothetical protein [Burkholderia gladioli pv. gladioli]